MLVHWRYILSNIVHPSSSFAKQASGSFRPASNWLLTKDVLCIAISHERCEHLDVIVDPLLVHNSSPGENPWRGWTSQNGCTMFNHWQISVARLTHHQLHVLAQISTTSLFTIRLTTRLFLPITLKSNFTKRWLSPIVLTDNDVQSSCHLPSRWLTLWQHCYDWHPGSRCG